MTMTYLRFFSGIHKCLYCTSVISADAWRYNDSRVDICCLPLSNCHSACLNLAQTLLICFFFQRFCLLEIWHSPLLFCALWHMTFFLANKLHPLHNTENSIVSVLFSVRLGGAPFFDKKPNSCKFSVRFVLNVASNYHINKLRRI